MLTTKAAGIAAMAPIGPAGEPPRAKYDRLIAFAKEVPPATTVVVHPCDETSLRGAVDAAQAGIIKPILVGPAATIANVARRRRRRASWSSRPKSPPTSTRGW